MSQSGASTFPPLPRSEEGVLAMLRTPPPDWTRKSIVLALCERGPLVRRAVEEGVIRLESQTEIVSALAAFGSLSLLRYLVSERSVDPNHRDARQYLLLFAALTSKASDRNALLWINEADADIHARVLGMTPLMMAAMRGSVEVVKATVGAPMLML